MSKNAIFSVTINGDIYDFHTLEECEDAMNAVSSKATDLREGAKALRILAQEFVRITESGDE